MIEILGQLVKFERGGNAVHAPGLGLGLEGTQQDLAGVFLVIGAFVGDAQHRHLGQAGDRLGDDVEMFAGLQRHVDPGHAADFVPPHAGAVDDHVTGDVALFAAVVGDPVDTGDPAPLAGNARNPGAFLDQRAALARALGQGQCDIGRIALPVLGQIDAANHAIDVEMVIARLDLGGRDFLDLDPEGARHGGRTREFFHPVIGQGNGDRTHPLEPGGDAGFGFETAVEFLAVFGQLGHVGGGAQLGDQAGGMPGGA